MSHTNAQQTARHLNISQSSVEAVLKLLEEKATVPFIARYRKEATGGLDEVQVRSIRDESNRLEELEKRKKSIIHILEEAGKLTPALEKLILQAETLREVEEIYAPLKTKRKTRADKAREKGYGPLAEALLAHKKPNWPSANLEEAREGALDIVAETVSQNALLRKKLKALFSREAFVEVALVKKFEQEAQKYRDYFDYREKASGIPSHRALAVLRGQGEGFLRVKARPDSDQAIRMIENHYDGGLSFSEDLKTGIERGWKKSLLPSLEKSILQDIRERSELAAIEIFVKNLDKLLMEPGLGNQPVLAVDPGLRTGCKVAVIDAQGDYQESFVIYPIAPHHRTGEAVSKIKRVMERYRLKYVAVGDGTGGRETVDFLAEEFPDLMTIPVSESGASVYSASETAAAEFPDLDLTVRGAISIGRRLQDPLNELVKVDPMSIGVGQYQHDLNKKKLKEALDEVVVSCVNRVGVDLNLGGESILGYISGLNAKIAREIMAHRRLNGPFLRREELLKVKGLGERAYLLSAGFLRIKNGKQLLDRTGIHPESYGKVDCILQEAGASLEEVLADSSKLDGLSAEQLERQGIGRIDQKDLVAELKQPGKDPRAAFNPLQYDRGVRTLEDLREGMLLEGRVTNVTAFGAFVDIGVHQDGLVHISHLANHFVKDPFSVVAVRDRVRVKVLSCDIERKRISLSMKDVDL